MAKTRSTKGINTSRKGKRLEVYAEQLFRDLGKLLVRRDVYYSFRSLLRKRVVRRAQVDVQYYDEYGKVIVECKYYDAWRVSAEDVRDFKRRIDLIRPDQALILTNSSLTRKGEELAKSFGIEVYDHEALQMLDCERQRMVGMLTQNPSRNGETLEEQLQEIDLRMYDLKKHYNVTKYVLF